MSSSPRKNQIRLIFKRWHLKYQIINLWLIQTFATNTNIFIDSPFNSFPAFVKTQDNHLSYNFILKLTFNILNLVLLQMLFQLKVSIKLSAITWELWCAMTSVFTIVTCLAAGLMLVKNHFHWSLFHCTVWKVSKLTGNLYVFI